MEAQMRKEAETQAELERQEQEEAELRKKRHEEWVCVAIQSFSGYTYVLQNFFSLFLFTYYGKCIH